jgi:hypothetical protein
VATGCALWSGSTASSNCQIDRETSPRPVGQGRSESGCESGRLPAHRVHSLPLLLLAGQTRLTVVRIPHCRRVVDHGDPPATQRRRSVVGHLIVRRNRMSPAVGPPRSKPRPIHSLNSLLCSDCSPPGLRLEPARRGEGSGRLPGCYITRVDLPEPGRGPMPRTRRTPTFGGSGVACTGCESVGSHRAGKDLRPDAEPATVATVELDPTGAGSDGGMARS